MTEETELPGAAAMPQSQSVALAIDVVVPPGAMTDDDAAALREQAGRLVAAVGASSGARQLAVLDEVTGLGLQSQRNAGRQLELVKTRLATFLDEQGSSRDVAGGLMDLRLALDRINPDLERGSLWGRTIGALPFMRDNAMVRALKRIALRYEPVSRQIVVIESRLREGRALLGRDNIELRRLYEDVEVQQAAVERQAYLAGVVVQLLEALLDDTTDELERDRIQAAAHDVAVRVQDLRAMETVHTQFFVSIELTRQNNNRLGQAVDRTLALATNVVTIGLAIQAALARQERVREATERTRAFLGDMILQNAQAIRAQTEAIGDLYNEPVVAIDKLTEAHQQLLAALEAASHLREDGIAAARRNVDELTVLTRDLGAHVHGLEEGRR